MASTYDGIRLYDINDWAFGHLVKKSMEYVDSYNETKQYTDINEVIELYNVHEILSNSGVRQDIRDKYQPLIKGYVSIVAVFFKNINSENFINYCDDVCIHYEDEFWGLFEKFEVYEQVDESVFYHYISSPYVVLERIIKYKNTVRHYDRVIADCMRESDQTAEIIIRNYMEKTNGHNRWFLPSSLAPTEYEEIIRCYIRSQHPRLNLLNLISIYQSTGECPISDKLRLEARNRSREMLNDGSVVVVKRPVGVCTIFKDLAETSLVEETDEGTIYYYSSQWIRDNLDYATLLNNFIYLFGYVDFEYRSVFPAKNTKVPLSERFFVTHGVKEYPVNNLFLFSCAKTSSQMGAYIEELEGYGINLESIFKWFFETYLPEEFNVAGFLYEVSSVDSTYLVKCRNIASEMDSVMKQYSFYVTEGEINRELLEISSQPLAFDNVPSMRKNKYAYACTKEIEQEFFLLFSDQSLLVYVERIKEEYTSFFELLTNETVYLSDYSFDDDVRRINWLIERKDLIIDGDVIKLNHSRVIVLKDIYYNEVICLDYYPKPLISVVKELIDSKDIYIRDSLFSIPEIEYMNYALNRKSYGNGLDLRNRYIHGTKSRNDQQNKVDYIELLKIMVMIVIKINEEFCMKESPRC